jgi:hypothetical protein
MATYKNKTVLSRNEAAEFLGVTAKHLRIQRAHHTGPEYLKKGRRVYYFVDDLLVWAEIVSLPPVLLTSNSRWVTWASKLYKLIGIQKLASVIDERFNLSGGHD